ncbi:hypothetical protein GpartN1_g6155.t1 [Galdieria partita]|uniref:Glycosyl transferase family 25 domain-containing protein n=1 Tax=Galdieria partita TaxID=83374 RepID=A0A9C7USN9_9RHOD|nr:hypothetical protein GpartN1_g6155.t1 [Galdieria partita]
MRTLSVESNQRKAYRVIFPFIAVFCFFFIVSQIPSGLFGFGQNRLETLSGDSWMTGEESGFELFGINRRDRLDRWRKFQRNVEQKIQHQVHRVEAVEMEKNWSNWLSPRCAVTIWRPYRGNHEDIANWNAVSCYLTHRKVWEQIVQFQKPGIVFEDDAVIRRNHLVRYQFLAELEQVFTRFPKAVVFLGYLSTQSLEGFPWVPSTQVSRHYLDITGNSVMGTHAYAISPQAAEFLVNVSLPIEVQIDAFICNTAFLYPHKLQILVRRKSKFRQAFHVSDIQSICFRCLFPYETPKYLIAIAILIVFAIVIVCLHIPVARMQAVCPYFLKRFPRIPCCWLKDDIYKWLRVVQRKRMMALGE